MPASKKKTPRTPAAAEPPEAPKIQRRVDELAELHRRVKGLDAELTAAQHQLERAVRIARDSHDLPVTMMTSDGSALVALDSQGLGVYEVQQRQE